MRGYARPSVHPSVHPLVTHKLKPCKSAVFDQNYCQYQRERILWPCIRPCFNLFLLFPYQAKTLGDVFGLSYCSKRMPFCSDLRCGRPFCHFFPRKNTLCGGFEIKNIHDVFLFTYQYHPFWIYTWAGWNSITNLRHFPYQKLSIRQIWWAVSESVWWPDSEKRWKIFHFSTFPRIFRLNRFSQPSWLFNISVQIQLFSLSCFQYPRTYPTALTWTILRRLFLLDLISFSEKKRKTVDCVLVGTYDVFRRLLKTAMGVI